MIRVCAEKHNGQFTKVEISGHAETAEYGEDLICAAVSAIAFGTCNALDLLCNNTHLSVGNNLISIESEGHSDKESVILDTAMIQLQTVEEMNPAAVKIEIMED